MRAFWQLYLANLKEFFRDRMTMLWVLAFPLMFIALFGVLLGGDNNPTYELGLADEDRGEIGARLARAVGEVEIFEVQNGERDDLLAALQGGELDLVLVVPAGTSAAVRAGETSGLEAHYDPTDQAVGQLVLGVIDQLVRGIDQGLSERPTLLTLETVSILPRRLSRMDFILPGILGMALMQLGLFSTASVMVQLREQQVLRRLSATPLSRASLLASQVAFRLSLAGLQTALILAAGVVVFDVSVAGSPLALAAFVTAGTLTFIALGYLVASLARTQESANALTQLVYLPMLLLSGLFFPLSIMPAWIRPVAAVLPLTYLADALRQLMTGATPDYALGLDMAVLGGWLAACTVLSLRLFRWE